MIMKKFLEKNRGKLLFLMWLIMFVFMIIMASSCSKRTTMCKTYSELKTEYQEKQERKKRLNKATYIVALMLFIGYTN